MTSPVRSAVPPGGVRTARSGRGGALLAALSVLSAALLAACAAGSAEDEARRDEARELHDAVLAEVYALEPELEARVEAAPGHAVLAHDRVNLLVEGDVRGRGVLVDHATGERTFLHLAVGRTTLGGDRAALRAVVVFHDADTLARFAADGWVFASPSAADLAQLTVYRVVEGELAAGATLPGAKCWPDR